MRSFGQLALLGMLLAVTLPAQSSPSAAQVLDEVRSILGPVATVNTLALLGTVKPETKEGRQSPSLPIEIYLVFPGQFAYVMKTPIGSMTYGADGDALLYRVDVPGAKSAPSVGMIQDAKFRLRVLGLLILGRTDGSMVLDKKTLIEGQKEITLRFMSKDNGPVFLDIEAASRLPVRVRYQAKQREGMNGPRTGPAAAISEEIRQRRVVEGVTIPIRLAIIRDAVAIQEYNFDSIQMNGKANLPDFKKLIYKN